MSDSVASKSYNLGRAVGWSAYEEFLKEYNVDSNLITEPVYIRAITFGVTRYLTLDLTDWAVVAKHEGGSPTVNYEPKLLTKTVPCPGADWGCTPIIGLDYTGFQTGDTVDQKFVEERGISAIYSCVCVNEDGELVSPSNRVGGYLKFFASPKIKEVTGDRQIRLIVRGLSVLALTGDAEDIQNNVCWGPQCLLFGGNGLTGGKVPEVEMTRRIPQDEDPIQKLVSSPVIDFQSEDPKSRYSGYREEAVESIKVESLTIPEENQYVSLIATLPTQHIDGTQDLDTLPSLYGAKIDKEAVTDPAETDPFVFKVVPLDTMAPYHFRVREKIPGIPVRSYAEYESLFPGGVLLLRDSIGSSTQDPSYIFEQVYKLPEQTSAYELLPVSDDTLHGILNTVMVRNVTSPMVVRYINPPLGGTTDICACMNMECSGALSGNFMDTFTMNPYPNGYDSDPSYTNPDLELLNSLLEWRVGNNQINAHAWDYMTGEERAAYRWFLANDGSTGAPQYWYLLPLEKKTGRFSFVKKVHPPINILQQGLPSFVYVRAYRYAFAYEKDNGESGSNTFHLTRESDISYYGATQNEVTLSGRFQQGAVCYAIFNGTTLDFWCNIERTHRVSWVNGVPVEQAPLTADDINRINAKDSSGVYINRELLYESVYCPSVGPNTGYVNTTYQYTADVSLTSHRISPDEARFLIIRPWTATEQALWKKACFGLEDGDTTGGYGPVVDEISPWMFFGEWWEPFGASEEYRNGSTIQQYIQKKEGRAVFMVDPRRHRPTLNTNIQTFLGITDRPDLWETAYSQLTMEDYYKEVCGFTDAEWTASVDSIFAGAPSEVRSLTIYELVLRGYFTPLYKQNTSVSTFSYQFNFYEIEDVREQYTNTGTLAGCTEFLKIEGKMRSDRFMNTYLPEVPAKYVQTGGPQAAVGQSGLHETWSLAVTDKDGSLLPMSGSDGLIPDPEDTSKITTWDDMIHWNHLIEALGYNKSIDLLGKPLREMKNNFLAGAGENYIQLKSGIRVYFDSQAPTDVDIPNGSIGLGW